MQTANLPSIKISALLATASKSPEGQSCLAVP